MLDQVHVSPQISCRNEVWRLTGRLCGIYMFNIHTLFCCLCGMFWVFVTLEDHLCSILSFELDISIFSNISQFVTVSIMPSPLYWFRIRCISWDFSSLIQQVKLRSRSLTLYSTDDSILCQVFSKSFSCSVAKLGQICICAFYSSDFKI